MANQINNPEYTVNDFIRDLQSLNSTYRSKPIVIRTPNGELHSPVVKQLLDEPHDVLKGWEHVEAAIVTY